VDTYDALTSCGGTKWCCSDVSECCSHPNLVFDIGTPSVINDYGSTKTYTTLPSEPTTGGPNTVITAAATSASATAVTGGSASAVTGISSASSSKSTAASSVEHKTIIIAVAAGVIAFLVLAILAGIVVFCVLKKKKKGKLDTPVNLIDMNPAATPQHVFTTSTAQLVNQPGQYGPEKTGFEPAPAYTPPHYQHTPTGPNGLAMFELQSPPVKQNVYHELG
jgi:hypothetical protein